MDLNIKKLSSTNFKTTSWSGGSTTELFIYPPEADFQQRDFDFRLSTATVEVLASNFTPLQDVSRTLMVLEGQMTLSHQNHHSKTLNNFEVDHFDGGWQTQSKGRCVDFNLMTKGQTSGKLEHITVEMNTNSVCNIESNYNKLFLFAYSGAINLILGNEHLSLNKGEMLVLALNEFESNEINLEALEDADLGLIYVKSDN
jgi:environmental stress-induced protein Ves